MVTQNIPLHHLVSHIRHLRCMRLRSSALDHGLAVGAGANPLDLVDVSESLPSRNAPKSAYLDSNKALNVLARSLARATLTLAGVLPRRSL